MKIKFINTGTLSRQKSGLVLQHVATAGRARTLHRRLRGGRRALERVHGVGVCVRGHACKGHARPHARRRRRHLWLQRPGLVRLLRVHALCCRSHCACALRTAASLTRIQTLFVLFQGPGCCGSLRSSCSGHLDMFISHYVAARALVSDKSACEQHCCLKVPAWYGGRCLAGGDVGELRIAPVQLHFPPAELCMCRARDEQVCSGDKAGDSAGCHGGYRAAAQSLPPRTPPGSQHRPSNKPSRQGRTRAQGSDESSAAERDSLLSSGMCLNHLTPAPGLPPSFSFPAREGGGPSPSLVYSAGTRQLVHTPLQRATGHLLYLPCM